MEKTLLPVRVKDMLNVNYVDPEGREFSKIFYCMGVSRDRECYIPPHMAKDDNLHLLAEGGRWNKAECKECLKKRIELIHGKKQTYG